MIKKVLQNLWYSIFALRMWKITWMIYTYSFPCPSRYSLGRFILVPWGYFHLCDSMAAPLIQFFFLCTLYRNIDAIGLWLMRDIFTIFLWSSYIPYSASVQDDSKNREWTFPRMINQRVWDYPPRKCSSFILLKGQHSVLIRLRMGSGKKCYLQIEFCWPRSQFLH